MVLCCVLLSPMTNLWATYSSSGPQADDMISTHMLEWCCKLVRNRLGEGIGNPIEGDFRDFPPMFIMTHKTELLAADSVALSERATAAGVQVKLQLHPHTLHTWPVLYFLDFPEAAAAFKDIREYIADVLTNHETSTGAH
jgi:acetyl esterase/lipase